MSSLHPDFSKFDEINSKQATIAIAKVVDAIAKDMQAQNRKFNKSKFSRWVDAAYSLSNKTAIRYGANVGRDLIEGKPIDGKRSFIRGSDLAKVVYYALDKEGHLPWANLRETLRAEGLDELSEVRQSGEPESVTKKLVEGIQRFDHTSASVAAQLRKLAEIIEPIEAQRDAYFTQTQKQNLAIVKHVTEKAQRDQIISEIEREIARLATQIKQTTDLKKATAMAKKMESVLKMFEELR